MSFCDNVQFNLGEQLREYVHHDSRCLYLSQKLPANTVVIILQIVCFRMHSKKLSFGTICYPEILQLLLLLRIFFFLVFRLAACNWRILDYL